MTPTRIGWASLAIAAAGAAFIGVTLLNSVDDATNRTGRLQQQLETAAPATAGDVRELGDQVHELATSAPTVVVTALPGPPGPAGAEGAAGTPGPPGRIIVRTVPAAPTAVPVPTRTARPPGAAAPSPAPTPAPTASSSAIPCSLPGFLDGRCQETPTAP